ncbi:MAG TPA: OmpH family outer membrane protein [Gammaproteobacteria bacterium]
MRKSLFIAIAAVAAVLAAPVQAAELKIGIVNTPKLIGESPQAQALKERLQEEFAPQGRELQAQQNEIKSLQEKFQRDGAVMSESERANMDRRIRELARDFQYGQETLAQDQRARYNEEMGKLQLELVKAIQKFAEAGGYDLILTEGVAYRADALDVTDQVLESLKKK